MNYNLGITSSQNKCYPVSCQARIRDILDTTLTWKKIILDMYNADQYTLWSYNIVNAKMDELQFWNHIPWKNVIMYCVRHVSETYWTKTQHEKNYLRWFGHIQCGPIDAPARRNDQILVKWAKHDWSFIEEYVDSKSRPRKSGITDFVDLRWNI